MSSLLKCKYCKTKHSDKFIHECDVNELKEQIDAALIEVDYHDFSWPDMPIELRKKLDIGPIYLNGARCPECGYFIRSKNRHHMQYCKCGACSIDGGSWYIRTIGNPELITINFKEQEDE